MNEPVITLVGNLADDPELRYLTNGTPVAKFRMAQTPRVKSGEEWKDGEPFWMNVTAWRQLGEHAAETLKRGMRVVVTGRLSQRTTGEGDARRTFTDLEAEDIGVSIRFGTASYTKAPSNGGGQSSGGGQRSAETSRQQQTDEAPW